MTEDHPPPPRLSREEAKEKIRAFLKKGDSDDIASLLVHSLMQRADKKEEQEDK